MKRALAFTGCLLFTSGMIFAQDQKMTPPEGFIKVTAPAGVYLQEGAMMGSAVKGAPFTAQQTTESTQTLADGTRISRTSSVTFMRDSQGRTRREDKGSIMINDSVAGVTYRLNKENRSGVKTQLLQNSVVTYDGNGLTYSVQLQDQAVAALKEQQARADEEKRLAEGTSTGLSQAAQEKIAAERGGGRGGIVESDNKNETQESLGSQMMDGVAVDGTRTTVVIPAGQIGNDRPLMIVTDRWYSPELHVYVMTRHTDPRSGESITKYTGIQRAEPDSALFQAPTGYAISELPRRVIKQQQ